MDETEIAAETMAIRAILTTVLSEIANLDPSLRSAIKRFNNAADVVSLQPPAPILLSKLSASSMTCKPHRLAIRDQRRHGAQFAGLFCLFVATKSQRPTAWLDTVGRHSPSRQPLEV
jgi:hypothetical protein